MLLFSSDLDTVSLSCTDVTIRLSRCNFSLINKRQHCKKQSIILRKCMSCGICDIPPPWCWSQASHQTSLNFISSPVRWAQILAQLLLKGWCVRVNELRYMRQFWSCKIGNQCEDTQTATTNKMDEDSVNLCLWMSCFFPLENKIITLLYHVWCRPYLLCP